MMQFGNALKVLSMVLLMALPAQLVATSVTDSSDVDLTVDRSPHVDLKANGEDGPLTIELDDGLLLSWTTGNDPDSCTALGDWSGAKDPLGGMESLGTSTLGSYLYMLSCSNSHGTTTDSVEVTVVEEIIEPPDPEPPEPEPDPRRSPPQAPAVPQISVVTVDAGVGDATVSWRTDHPTRSVVQWGETPEYASGSISGLALRREHSVEIGDLSPNTLYYLRIEVFNLAGGSAEREGLVFITDRPADSDEPPNVGRFTARGSSPNSIILEWSNPVVSSFQKVRLVRSRSSFTPHPLAGEVVYRGTGQSFLDSGLSSDTYYFYSLFVRDQNGRYSSGALAFAKTLPHGLMPDDEPDPFDEGEPVEHDPILPPDEAHPDELSEAGKEFQERLRELTLDDVEFYQYERRIDFENGTTVPVDQFAPVTVSIDAELVPRQLGSPALFLRGDGGSRLFDAYVLRYSEEDAVYRARLPGFSEIGHLPFSVSFLYQGRSLRNIDGSFRVTESILATPTVERADRSFGARLLETLRGIVTAERLVLFLFAAIIFVLILIVISRRRQ